MKLGCRLYIYEGYYFEFLSSNNASLIQNESYQQSPKKMKNSDEHEGLLSLLSSFINLIDLYTKVGNIYLQGFLAKHSVVWEQFSMGLFHYPQSEMFFQIY